MTRLATWAAALVLLVGVVTTRSAIAQTVTLNRAIAPPPTTLQSAVTADGNGSAVTVAGYATVLVDVACTTCGGGTTVNFQASADGSVFRTIQGLSVATATIATSTTASGMWQITVSGSITAIRTTVSTYSAGTITVKAYPSVLAAGPLVPLMRDLATFNQSTSGYVPIGGTYQSVITDLTDGQAGAVALTPSRSFHVSLYSAAGASQIGQQVMAASLPVTIASNQTAFPVTVSAGSAVIGHVITDTSSTTAVTGNVASTVADGANVNQGANADAVVAAGAAGTISAKLRAISRDLVANIVLATGANAIGKLAANSGVDIGDVDVTSVAPGVAATNLGKAEDAAHASGDVGVFALGVANEANAQIAGTDGDYTIIKTDRTGQLFTDHCPSAAMIRGTATTTGTSDTSLVAASGSASLKTYVYSAQIVNTGSTAALITFKDGNGGSTLGYTIAPASGSGSNIVFEIPLVTTANTALYFAAGSSSTTVYASAQGCKAP